MGSSGNQSPWAPYDTYKDCSQGICSIYCPQWCYIIFPPPPPPSSFAEDDSSADFSPLIIAVIGILASAFILVSYFTLISKYCRRRGHDSSVVEFSENRDQGNGEAWPAGISDGLDETLIKSITVCRYKKNDGFVESTDCSVCLSEFQENENLRLLPKCSHAFHIPCIDTWLKSHSNCPLCRANITPAHIFPTNQTQPVQETHSAGNVQMAAFEYQNRNDAAVVIDDLEVGVCEDCVVNLADVPKTESEGSREDVVQTMRRSVSLNSAQVSIADILRVTGDAHDDDGLQIAEMLGKNRDSVLNLVAMKRSVSTGRFMLTRSEKGWSSTTILS